MADLQPPPTYTDPVRVDEVTGKGRFSEIWLNWFLQLANTINGAGGIVIIHNSLGSIQGGTTAEYYHLTSAQHSAGFGNKTANTFYAGPATGAAAVPGFRALVTADLPAGTGTVTSVTVVSADTNISSSGGPITTSGTITLTFNPTQSYAFAARHG